MRIHGTSLRLRAGLGRRLSMAGTPALRTLLTVGAVAALGALCMPANAGAASRYAASSRTIAGAAKAAQKRFGVPASLLEAICYFEGHLSDHGGAPSSDGGYGCMDLARNSHLDTLGQATTLLGVSVTSIRRSQALNIAGAAAVLRADAIALSPSHRVPATLGGWYGAVAKYSGAAHDIAVMYASEVYRILRLGLTATTRPSGSSTSASTPPATSGTTPPSTSAPPSWSPTCWPSTTSRSTTSTSCRTAPRRRPPWVPRPTTWTQARTGCGITTWA